MMLSLLFWLFCFVSLSFQHVEQSCKFKKEFPTLAGLNSQILEQLGKPSAIPKDNIPFSHELWLTCNPVYGAHLWRHKTIDSLAFMLKQSKNIEETFNQAKFTNQMFSEIHSIQTIVNSEAIKTGYGRLAGHLFLFDLKKRKWISNGKSAGKTEILSLEAIYHEMEKLFPKKFSLEDLKSLMECESQGEFCIPNFMTSMISAFVFADIDRSKSPKAAANFLKTYRTEFDEVLKAELKGRNLHLNLEKSPIHQDLDANIQVISLFQDIFFAFCNSFVRSEVPKELHYSQGVTVNGQSWANCTEIAFTNLVMGAFYDPVNHSFKMQNFGINDKLSGILAKNNGFDSFISQSEVSECYQNLPFVLYNQLKIPGKKLIITKNFHLSYFASVPKDFYNKITEKEKKEEFEEIGSIKGKMFGPKDGFNCSVFLVNRQAFPEYFFFEVASCPTNFMLLGHHMNFKNLQNVFTNASDIFDLFLKNQCSVEEYFGERSAFGECDIDRLDDSFSLKFSFGKLNIFECHSVFEFSIEALAEGNFTFSKDYLLRTILDEKDDESMDSLQKALWSISQKKYLDWKDEILVFQIPLLEYVKKVDFFDSKKQIVEFAFENLKLWNQAVGNSDLRPMLISSFNEILDEVSINKKESILISELATQADQSLKFGIIFPLLHLAASKMKKLTFLSFCLLNFQKIELTFIRFSSKLNLVFLKMLLNLYLEILD